jgi:PPE-repeat protein
MKKQTNMGSLIIGCGLVGSLFVGASTAFAREQNNSCDTHSFSIAIADSNAGINNRGLRNNGNGNIGDENAGDNNVGCRNNGNNNIGNNNEGNNNIGDNNVGNGNTGNNNEGDGNFGSFNTGNGIVGSHQSSSVLSLNLLDPRIMGDRFFMRGN